MTPEIVDANLMLKFCIVFLVLIIVRVGFEMLTENKMKSIHYIDRKTGEMHQEIVPGEKWLQWLYHHPFGKLALQSVVKRKFLTQWYGKKMDAPASRAKNVLPSLYPTLASVCMKNVV